jgi:ABC-type antimicrobial peptide transport system permease subunit
MAKTLFGNADPMGQTFSLDDKHLMEVVAVFKDYPQNSSFQNFKMIAPFMHSYPTWMRDNLYWGNIDYETFCLLNEKADTASVNAQMRKITEDATAGQMSFFYPVLQRLDEIHLYSAKLHGGMVNTTAKSDIGKVKMLLLLAVIILVVACINYMNLSTARAQKRSREIGISKTVGAKRYEIVTRLLFETGIFTFISFMAAVVVVAMVLQVFNNLMGEQLQFELVLRPLFICVALLIWILTTLFAASSPALYMSGFPPLMAIRQSATSGKSSHAVVRKILSVGQFAVAIVLIAWVLIIQTQIKFMNNKDLGYNPRNLISIWSNSEAFENDLRAESSVEMLSRGSSSFFNANGNTILKNADDKMGFSLTSLATTPDFIDLMQMKLIAGRTLPDHTGDSIVQVILNRAAVDYIGMTPEEAIGKRVLLSGVGVINEVCGVVENFNFESLYSPVRGFAIHNQASRQKRCIMFRVKEGNINDHLKTYEQIFKKHFPNNLFEPGFLDLNLEKAYEGERRTSRVAVVFSLLAILVACMGVFGLTAVMAEQRTKEIGIRKVLGATVWNIVSMFTNNYVKLLLISLLIAIPAAWWVGNQYLQNFAYRISLGWWIFAVAGIVTIVLTLLTVAGMAIKAATKNPVEAIKSE